ncbi:MAG: non-homologous end-joining DNA ligase [Micromonosporaceae bacterium]
MMATLVRELPGDQDRYGWELKWDGVRAVAYLRGGEVRLLSRNDKDMSASYPELRALGGMVREPAVLDGEIVAVRDGRPDFGALQNRMHVQRPSPQLVMSVPVHYYVFDLLHHGGRSLLDEPYTARREQLARLALDHGAVHTPPWYHGGAGDVLASSAERGLEGVVGKPLTSRYYPGKRREWIKVKNVRHQEVVVAGWKAGEGNRANMIGSLLLGIPGADGRLRYAGHVGTGFTASMLRDLGERLRPLGRPDSPFSEPLPRRHAAGANWVEPRLVGEVAFTEWSSDGMMRHPAWRGLRPDKEPREVRLEG